jgi:hypothetical protein
MLRFLFVCTFLALVTGFEAKAQDQGAEPPRTVEAFRERLTRF